jgi:hypothetical protein
MSHRTQAAPDQASPYAGNSLVPMLIIGLVLTFAGMIAAVLWS